MSLSLEQICGKRDFRFFLLCEDYDPDIVSVGVDEIKELGKRENKKKSKRIEREREREITLR